MKTIHKLGFAKLLFIIIKFFRKLSGKGLEFECTRKGIRWDLDIREGVDLSLYVMGYYEPEVVEAYKEVIEAGDIVVDIGANTGGHTLVFADLVGAEGRVHAIEATQWAVERLNKNLSLNPNLRERTQVHHLALVAAENHRLEKDPSASFRIDTNLSDDERNSLDCGYSKSLGNCDFKTLDGFVLSNQIQKIDLLKIDVDGNEIKVLKGANHVLSTLSPRILIELSPVHFVNPEEPFEDLILILRNHGYKLIDFQDKELSGTPTEIKESIKEGVLINVWAVK